MCGFLMTLFRSIHFSQKMNLGLPVFCTVNIPAEVRSCRSRLVYHLNICPDIPKVFGRHWRAFGRNECAMRTTEHHLYRYLHTCNHDCRQHSEFQLWTVTPCRNTTVPFPRKEHWRDPYMVQFKPRSIRHWQGHGNGFRNPGHQNHWRWYLPSCFSAGWRQNT